MTDGANFDQDEIERFGDPWHGLFRGGVLELPNATTRALLSDPENGESYKVMIPGQAAVTTSTADADAGMTWLNYGVLAGKTKLLYGVELGEMRWIWIDDDGKPWLVTLSEVSGTVTASVQNFGDMPGTAETYSDSVALPDYLVYPGADVRLAVDDIDSTGRNVAICQSFFYDASTQPSYPSDFWNRLVMRVWLLTISGSGSGISISVSLEHSRAAINSVDTNTSTDIYWQQDTGTLVITGPFDGLPTVPGYNYAVSKKSGVAIQQYQYCDGATLVDDVFAFVLSEFDSTNDITVVHDLTSLFDLSDPDIQPSGGSPYWKVRADTTQDISGYRGIRVDGTLTSATFTHTFVTDVLGGFTDVSPYEIGGETGTISLRWYLHRLGNRAYSLTGYDFGDPNDNLSLLVGGPVSGLVDPLWSADSFPRWATAHYDTGALEVSSSGIVCFV